MLVKVRARMFVQDVKMYAHTHRAAEKSREKQRYIFKHFQAQARVWAQKLLETHFQQFQPQARM